jgi:hypothetical protein
MVKGDNCRMELRSPDPACNPYLAIGLILAAGLDGIEQRMVLQPPVNRNLFDSVFFTHDLIPFTKALFSGLVMSLNINILPSGLF